MLITFSDEFVRNAPDLVERIDLAAIQFNTRPLVTWVRGARVRFILEAQSGRMADARQHDDVIGALLGMDPQAEIRTAKAHYHGRSDFLRQMKASVE